MVFLFARKVPPQDRYPRTERHLSFALAGRNCVETLKIPILHKTHMVPHVGVCFTTVQRLFRCRWKRALPDDQLEVFLSGGTRRSELVCLRAQVHFYGYLLVESAANGATPDGESVHLWRGLLEVVGCIVSITPIGSAVQPANFPRLGLFHPEDDENGF